MKWLLLLLLSLPASAFAGEHSLPPRAEALLGREAAFKGPNCWNAALYAAGLVKSIRYVDYDEFTAWLESPLCQEVEKSAALPGDIVALRRVSQIGRLVNGPYGYEIHGYLLLAGGMAFTKNGDGKHDAYHIESVDSVHAFYETVNRKDCRILGLPKELCSLRAQYFRCSPDTAPIGSVLEEKAAAIENELHALNLGETVPTDEAAEKERLQQRIDGLASEAASVDKENWRNALLLLRLDSYRTLPF